MSQILVVKKGNSESQILSQDKDKYLSMGYCVLDSNGEVSEIGKATTVSELSDLVDVLKADNEKLKTEIKKLKSENKKLKDATKVD